jgi:hypothetical protein
MSNQTKFSVDMTQSFFRMLGDVLTREEVNKKFDLMMKELNSRKNEIVAGILLNIKKEVDIDNFGDKVTFTIKEINNK